MSQKSTIPAYIQRPGATRFPKGSPKALPNTENLSGMKLRRKNNSPFAQSVDLALRAAQRWRAQGLGRCPNWKALMLQVVGSKPGLRSRFAAVKKSVGIGSLVHAVPPGRRDSSVLLRGKVRALRPALTTDRRRREADCWVVIKASGSVREAKSGLVAVRAENVVHCGPKCVCRKK